MVLGLLDQPQILYDRIARAFKRSGAIQAVALDIPRLLTEFGMLVCFTNLSHYGILGQIFGLISSFLSNIPL